MKVGKGTMDPDNVPDIYTIFGTEDDDGVPSVQDITLNTDGLSTTTIGSGVTLTKDSFLTATHTITTSDTFGSSFTPNTWTIKPASFGNLGTLYGRLQKTDIDPIKAEIIDATCDGSLSGGTGKALLMILDLLAKISDDPDEP